MIQKSCLLHNAFGTDKEMGIKMQPHFFMERKFHMEMLGEKTILIAVLKPVYNMCNCF